MRRPATTEAIPHFYVDEDAAYRFAGLLIVSLFPALFWTALIAGIGSAVGHTPSPVVLMTFGTTVAGICAAVFHALVARA